MLTLYLDGRLTGFAKATKTSGAAKFEEKPSCVGIDFWKWEIQNSEIFLQTYNIYPGQEQSLYPSLRMRGAGN